MRPDQVPPRLIPDEQFKARLNAIMPNLMKSGKAKNNDEIRELFNLHNDIFYPTEHKWSCSGCRSIVWNKMLKYYTDNNG